MSDETRETLVDAARDCLADVGFSVTTRAIAEHAQVNPALVNYHFGSKQALLLAALDASVAAMSEGFREPARLGAWLEAATEYAAQGMDHRDARVLFAATLEAVRNRTVAKAVAGHLGAFRRALRALVDAEGLPEGKGLAIVLAATLDGLLLHQTVDPKTDLRAASRALLRITRHSRSG